MSMETYYRQKFCCSGGYRDHFRVLCKQYIDVYTQIFYTLGLDGTNVYDAHRCRRADERGLVKRFVTTDERKHRIESLTKRRERQSYCISSYPMSSVLKRRRCAMVSFHLSEFILSSFGMLLNFYSKKHQSSSRIQLQKAACCDVMKTEALF